MLYIVILNHHVLLVNKFVRIFYLLSFQESVSGSFPIKIFMANLFVYRCKEKLHNNKSHATTSYFFLIFPTINNINGRIKQIVKDNGVHAVAIKF